MHSYSSSVATDYWEERANKVLSNFNFIYPDEIDMYEICWRYGIRIMPLDEPFTKDFLDYDSISHLKAFSIPKSKNRRGTIFIRSDLDYIEKKILLAEEFCHVYSHYANQLTIDLVQINKIENQAKRMSAYLLMPKKFLKQVFNAALEQAVMISEIADYFLVTEEFAQFRLSLEFKHKIDGFAAIKNNIGTIEFFE